MNFMQFAEAHGLILDRLVEGRWARTKTIDKRTSKRNGSYKFLGSVGFVINYATMDSCAVWHSDGSATRVDRVQLRELQRQHAKELARRQAWARKEAARLISECQRGTHPYLKAKGFPIAQGLVHPSGDLVIPMRDFADYGVVNTVQRIAPDSAKLFLPGGKAKGSVFVIGKGARQERWLVEGYATGLSLQAALLDLRRHTEIIVCFSAGNLGYIAQSVRRPAFVFADNDASGTGRRVAMETGLPWVMPVAIGMDANDVHQKHGLRALVSLIRGIDQFD